MDTLTLCTSEEPIQNNPFLDLVEAEQNLHTKSMNRYAFGIRGDAPFTEQKASAIVRFLLSMDPSGGEWVCTWGRPNAFGSPFGPPPDRERVERLSAGLEHQITAQRIEQGWTLCGPDPALPSNRYVTNRHVAVIRAEVNTIQGLCPSNYRLPDGGCIMLLLGSQAQGCSPMDQSLRPDLALLCEPGYFYLNQPLADCLVQSGTSVVYAMVDTTAELFGIIVVGPIVLDTAYMVETGIIDQTAPYAEDKSMWAAYKKGLDPTYRRFR